MKSLFKYIKIWKEKERLNRLTSEIKDCCFWRVNFKNESSMSYLRKMKMFGYSDEAISVAMAFTK